MLIIFLLIGETQSLLHMRVNNRIKTSSTHAAEWFHERAMLRITGGWKAARDEARRQRKVVRRGSNDPTTYWVVIHDRERWRSAPAFGLHTASSH
jgi:hypothetical protein